MVVLVVVIGLLAGFSLPGVFTEWRLGRALPDGDARHETDSRRRRGVHWGRRAHRGRRARDDQRPDMVGDDEPEPQSDFDRLFAPEERRELEAAFAEAHTEELEQLRARASEEAARLRSSAVPVYEVCSIGAGHRAETLRVRFADGTTVVLCCRGSSGSYWVQALRRQILSGSVVLDRMTFGLAGPVVVFGTPAGEVFVMADLITIGS
jgi:hypothetical protein